MGLSEGMSKMSQQVQDGVRMTVSSLLTWILKVASSLFFGFVVALIAQEVLKSGTVAFLFVMLVVTGTLSKLMQKWSALNVMVFDLICMLVGLSLKMYILLAP